MPGVCVGGPQDGRRVAARGAPAFLWVKGALYKLAETGIYLFVGHTYKLCGGCGAYNAVGKEAACRLCGGELLDGPRSPR